jgi:DNA-binding transcriptional LysR family regulator
MIDLDQLNAFVAIAQRGTVTAAAAGLYRSQSAISRRLLLLEDAVGAQLFDRRGAVLALTDAGRAFLPFAESALAAVASGRDAAQLQLAPGAGTASIAIVGTLVEAPLAQALGELVRRSLKLSLLTATSAEVSRLVRQGEANLGVRYFDEEEPDMFSETIGVERMCVVASSQYDLPTTAEHGTTRRWIGFPLTRTSKADFGKLLQEQLAALGVSYSEVMAVDSLSAQKRLVAAGLGIALLPESSVSEELRRGTLEIIDMPRVAISIPIVLLSRRDGYVSPATAEVASMLRQAMGTSTPR